MSRLGQEKVTVAICVRNGQKYIAEAILSAKNQTKIPHQILIIDDGSDDYTAAIAQELGCEVEFQGKLGLGAARNTALAKAQGDFVFFLDYDDLMADTALMQLLGTLRHAPNAKGAIGFRKNFISPELLTLKSKDVYPQYRKEKNILPSGSLWKKEIQSRIHFNTKSEICDVEWILSFRKLKLVWAETSATVLQRRVHLENTTNRKEVREQYLQLALKRLRKEL